MSRAFVVRLDEEIIRRLGIVAKATGRSKAEVLRGYVARALAADMRLYGLDEAQAEEEG